MQSYLPYDPKIPLLGIQPKVLKTRTDKDTCTPVFVKANGVNNSNVDQQMNKQNVVYPIQWNIIQP